MPLALALLALALPPGTSRLRDAAVTVALAGPAAAAVALDAWLRRRGPPPSA